MHIKQNIADIQAHFSTIIDAIDIELIIAHVLEKDRVFVIAHEDYVLTDKQTMLIYDLCTQRAHGYPLAYITHTKEFFGRNFIVSEDTLIPRPETELMITTIIEHIIQEKKDHILLCDIGTGSGIIPITLTKELHNIVKNTSYIASDISLQALAIAQKNLVQHNSGHITLSCSDLLSDDSLTTMIHTTQQKNILFTANLPYVNCADKKKLLTQKNSTSLAYEPACALWSDDKGLAHYKKLITQTHKLHQGMHHITEITSFYEIDPQQPHDIIAYITTIAPNSIINIYQDLTHRPRIVQWTHLNA